MNGPLRKTSVAVVVVAGMLSWNANAQYSCDDVEYHADVLENYPELTDACQGVVERNGNLYTKIMARIGYKDSMDRRSVQLVMNDGSLGPRHRIRQRPDFNVTTYDGEQISWQDLAPSQDITVYIPHDRWAMVHIDDMGMEEDLAADSMMEDEVVEVTEFAMVPVEDELPTTASNRYLTLYSGLAALFVAGSMWLRRRVRR